MALRLGALYAGVEAARRSGVECSREYSEALGIAYQIRDDLDDLDDVTAMRPSLLLATAHERATGAAKDKLAARWRREGGLTVAEVAALYEEAGASERCTDLLERYKEAAIRSLRDLEQPGLKGLLRRVVGKIFNDTEIKGWCKEFTPAEQA